MLDDFVAEYTGKANTGDTPENKGQCVGLVEVWFDELLEPHVWGDAKDLYANAGVDYLKGTVWPAPQGAAVVFNGWWGSGAGHTAISLGGGRVFEQNNPTGAAPRVNDFGPLAPRGYIGYILPTKFNKGDQKMSTLVTADMAAQLGNLVSLREGAAQSDPQFVNSIIGQPVEVVIPALMQSAERHQFVDRFLAGQKAIDELDALKNSSAPSNSTNLEAENNSLLKQILAKITSIFK